MYVACQGSGPIHGTTLFEMYLAAPNHPLPQQYTRSSIYEL